MSWTVQRTNREWVFVGSSLGLSYAPGAASAMPDMYHNVYIKPEAYRELVKTGKFPEGTMLAMEMTTADAKKDPALRGSFESEFLGLEVAVKDRAAGDTFLFRTADRTTKTKPNRSLPAPAVSIARSSTPRPITSSRNFIRC